MRKERFHRLRQSANWDPISFDGVHTVPDLLSAVRYMLFPFEVHVLFRGSLRLLSSRPNHETAFTACLQTLSVTFCALYLTVIHQQMNILTRAKIVTISISKMANIITENKHYFHSLIILNHLSMHLIFKITKLVSWLRGKA